MRPRNQADERTCFQEAGPYDPRLDSRADVAVVYGITDTFEERVERWRQAGYRVHVMTGVSWGQYQDYVGGEWDGKPHYDDAQTAAGDFRLEHGMSQGHDCFYMMPSEDYARYLGEKLRRVVDAGADAIHLEEPEFWVRAGYSPGFRREWQAFYGEPWQDPTSSPDAQYRAARLKQHLYTRTLDYLFGELKEYAASRGQPDFRCYVPTHSLLNYAHWRIVSPESRMLALSGCDGIIAQVWTGTSRTPTVCGGRREQRTFEAGYCEYSAAAALVRGTDQRLWMLSDPIEDNPNFCWDDYRQNWESTVVASLLVTQAERFEIMPWPRRIFTGTYPTVNLDAEPLEPLRRAYERRLELEGDEQRLADTRRAFEYLLRFYIRRGEESRRETLGFADLPDRAEQIRFGDLWAVAGGFYQELADWEDQEEAQRLRDAVAAFYHHPTEQVAAIPQAYATELQVVFNALADAAWPDQGEWLWGQPGVGLAISDSLMFQRGDPDPSDGDMSSVYGLALPLVGAGAALDMVQLERLDLDEHWEAALGCTRVLLLTYEGQKPPSARTHEALAHWVRGGGALLLFGLGDAYDTVREWWNAGDVVYGRPQDHLTELLGLGRGPVPGEHACGAGLLVIEPASPAGLAHQQDGGDVVRSVVRSAHQFLGLDWKESPLLALRRGPYVIAAGLGEDGGAGTEFGVNLPGTFVNLFDAGLAVRDEPPVAPGSRLLLCDLSRSPGHPWVVAASGRVRDEAHDTGSLRFTLEGMDATAAAVRVQVPRTPTEVRAIRVVDGSDVHVTCTYQLTPAAPLGGTALLGFASEPEGVSVILSW